ncbi:MAG: InlB B-repeat-containing protein [Clostridia bacterium]|nr:InlB B-repeat-containing protein [Clostridia bacterium]
MKKYLSLFIVFLMIVTMIPASAFANGGVTVWDGTVAEAFAGGTGTEKDPYLISNAAELAYLAKSVNEGNDYSLGKYFKLTADIVLNDTSNLNSWGTTPPAYEWTPIGAKGATIADNAKHFKGYFDGDGHTISGMYIGDTTAYKYDYAGLFGLNTGGTIERLGIIDSYIMYYSYVGSVAGYNGGTICECYNKATVSGLEYVGGIAGFNSNGTVENCYNAGSVNGYTCLAWDNAAPQWIGGITGANFSSEPNGTIVRTCYNIGTVSGCENEHIGGITGENHVYPATATIVFENCYYDIDCCTALQANLDGIDRLLSELTQKSTYVGFDFTGNEQENVSPVWTMEGNSVYPYAELVFVRDATPVPMLGVSAPDLLEIAINDPTALNYEINPADADNPKVTFESADETIATVDENGVITGVAEGQTEIITKTDDGGFTAKTVVVVHPDSTVTYVVDGETLEEYTVKWNHMLEEIPEVPAKEGHDQVDPYWDIDLTDTEITEDCTVNAVYTINEYTVIYYVDDVIYRSYDFKWGEEMTDIPVPPKGKEGHDQVAPYWSVDLTHVPIEQDYEIYVIYTINKYTVTYVADGETVETYNVDWNSTLNEIPAVPDKEGHTGTWDTDLSGVAITEDYTVTADYEIKTYTVTYVVDGETVETYEVDWNTLLSEIPEIPPKAGHDQVAPRWDTDLDGEPIKQDYTVNAVYTINKYTVTYVADGETVGAYEVDWNDTLSEIPEIPDKEGHDQVAPYWYIDLDGEPIKQDYTVNAVYTINKYTVTYVANGETVDTYTVNWNDTLETIPAIPPKAGHDQIAPYWEHDLDGIAITEDYTVEAVYTINTYTVTYVVDGETVKTYPVDWNATLPEIPAIPAKEGHDKTPPRWDTDLDGVAITEDLTVTAVYTINTYTVTYVADGETVETYILEWNDTLSEIPEVPSKVGYVHEWDTDLTDVAITDDYTVTAVYTLSLFYGDANCDGEIDAFDAALILRFAVDLDPLTELGMMQGDVTGVNNFIPDSADAAAILRYVVKIIDIFPTEEANN